MERQWWGGGGDIGEDGQGRGWLSLLFFVGFLLYDLLDLLKMGRRVTLWCGLLEI